MAKILIIGVGGGGTNAIRRMKEVGIPNADYTAIGTRTIADLENCPHKGEIIINEKLNR